MYEELHDAQWLREQYVDKHRTLQDIANEIGCCKTSVSRALRRNGVDRRKRTSKYPLLEDRDWLYEQYVVQERNLNDIADTVGSTPGNVGEHLRQKGIHRRSQQEAHLLRFPDGMDGEKHPRWNGGRVVQSGYVYLYAPDHPYRAKGKPYVQEHRLVMEEILGRYLEPHEVVHHKDGDRQNNHPDNLEVKSRGMHVSEHFQASHEVLEQRECIEELEAEVERLKAEIERLKQ